MAEPDEADERAAEHARPLIWQREAVHHQRRAPVLLSRAGVPVAGAGVQPGQPYPAGPDAALLRPPPAEHHHVSARDVLAGPERPVEHRSEPVQPASLDDTADV